jgi:hypothetical protein
MPKRGPGILPLSISLAVFLSTVTVPVPFPAAAEPLPAGPANRGLVTVGSYQIFPENRPGNAVYGENVLLLSLPGQVIQDVAALPAKNRFIYLARQGENRTVAVRTGASDPPPRIMEVSPGYYFVVTVLDGVAYKKLLRVTGASLVDLLPLSKTADGITVGAKGLLFFHIGKMEQQVDGSSAYSLGIHFAPFDENRVRHLPEPVRNTQPALAFKWLDDTRFQFTLADGTATTLSIADLK